LVSALAILVLLSSFLVPAAFASDTFSVSASPSPAAPNNTVTLSNVANLAGALVGGPPDKENLFYVAVLTPSGAIWGSSDWNTYQALTTSPGTGTCNIPYGGAVASGSSAVSGGASDLGGGCAGSDAFAWAQIGTTLCGGICTGPSGFADLVTFCPTIVSLALSDPYFPNPFGGDTSQSGTYKVVACWNNVATSIAVPVQTSFVIVNPSGVPEFPSGLALLMALAVPALIILRRRAGPDFG
jgi:hypothetical protein